MLGRLRKTVRRPFDRAVQWFLPPPATEHHSPESIEMRPLADLRRQTYASVSFEDLQAAAEREDRALEAARAQAPRLPLLLLSVLHAALDFLAKPFKSQALRRAYTAEQRFMSRRVCSRFQRVLWIGRVTLFWGVLLTLVSSCGVVLALTGDLGKLLGQQPRLWFVKFGTYLMSYFTVLHVAQVVCAILLLIAVKMAETSPPRLRDPTDEEFLQWFSLGLLTITRFTQTRETVSSPSENPPTPAPLPDTSPERTPAVLQIQAQIEHNPNGQRPTAYIRSHSSARTLVPAAPNASSSTSRSPEAVKCEGSPSGRAAVSSFRSTTGEHGTTQRKFTRGFSPDATVRSLIEELQNENAAETSNKRAPRKVRLRTSWLWVSAVTLATYTITAMALYCAGSVAIPTTLCAIIVLATPCILDVLAEVLGVSEEVTEDLQRLFGTGPSYESIVETGQGATATSPRGTVQGDTTTSDSPTSRLNEATSLLRFK